MFQVYNREMKYPRNLISGDSKTTFYHKKILIPDYFLKSNLFYSTRFFISNTFISNARLILAKNQAKAKQHPEAENLLFEKLFTFFIYVIIQK